MTSLKVYWRPGCGYCRRLERALHRAGVHYDAIDIWQTPEAAAFVRSVADGTETVPTVCLDDTFWVNPRPEDLLRDIADRAPELISPGGPRPGRPWSRWVRR